MPIFSKRPMLGRLADAPIGDDSAMWKEYRAEIRKRRPDAARIEAMTKALGVGQREHDLYVKIVAAGDDLPAAEKAERDAMDAYGREADRVKLVEQTQRDEIVRLHNEVRAAHSALATAGGRHTNESTRAMRARNVRCVFAKLFDDEPIDRSTAWINLPAELSNELASLGLDPQDPGLAACGPSPFAVRQE